MIFTDKNDRPFSFGSRVSVKVGNDYIQGYVKPSYEIHLDRATPKGVDILGMRSPSGSKPFIRVVSHPNGDISNSNNGSA